MSDDCLLSVFLPLNVAVQTVYDNFRQYVLAKGCRVFVYLLNLSE